MKRLKTKTIVSLVFIIFGIVLIIISASIGFSNGHIFNFNRESFSKKIEEKITSVDLQYVGCEILVCKGDEFKVVADNVRDNSLGIEINNGTLRIYNKDNVKFNIGINNSSKMTVYIPSDTQLESFKADCGAGVLKVNDIKASYVKLNNGAGLSSFNNITADKISIKGGAGKIEANNVFSQNLDVDGGVGEVDIKGDIQGDCTIKSGIGAVKLRTTANQDDYCFRFSNAIGHLRINGHSYKDYNECSNGKYTMKISNGIGQIDVYFE